MGGGIELAAYLLAFIILGGWGRRLPLSTYLATRLLGTNKQTNKYTNIQTKMKNFEIGLCNFCGIMFHVLDLIYLDMCDIIRIFMF